MENLRPTRSPWESYMIQGPCTVFNLRDMRIRTTEENCKRNVLTMIENLKLTIRNSQNTQT